jgi:hypothetical protein
LPVLSGRKIFIHSELQAGTATMTTKKYLWTAVLLAGISSCATQSSWQEEVALKPEPSTPWREKFLLDGIGHLHMDEVSKTLGKPLESKTLNDGSSEATYQYTSFSVPGTVAEDIGQSTCTDYIVKFDRDGVVRHARRKKC